MENITANPDREFTNGRCIFTYLKNFLKTYSDANLIILNFNIISTHISELSSLKFTVCEITCYKNGRQEF